MVVLSPSDRVPERHTAFVDGASGLKMETINKEGKSQKILAPKVSIPATRDGVYILF